MGFAEVFLFAIAFLHSISTTCAAEIFNETLTIRPLRDGRVSTRFSFVTTLEQAAPRSPETLNVSDTAQHYSLFPLSLGQILREYAVTEMHLSLNSGKWNYDQWGYPEEPSVGSGAELWAWMSENSLYSAHTRWKGLRNGLAGLFCASLASLEEQRTTSPSRVFRPHGSLLLPQHERVQNRLFYASLPSEHVCTENLTPFLKLLPCKGFSGIASLLNPHKLFDADWHGMGIHVHWDKQAGIIVRFEVQAVFDSVRLSIQNKRDWSFNSLFERSIRVSCPVASSSLVHVAMHDDASAIVPHPDIFEQNLATFNTSQVTEPLDVRMNWPSENQFVYPLKVDPSLTAISVRRTLTGPTQSRGQLSLSITNNQPIEMELLYLETMPWLVEFYLHTMRISVDGQEKDNLFSLLTYVPPVAHGSPMLLEGLLTLPPSATLRLSLEVTKSFLRYTEHPPDAQRGWDLPPAVLMPIRLNSSFQYSGQYPQALYQRIYTSPLLVDLATPDFSMPYHVIIMTCTLITLIFGTIFNLMTRRFVVLRIEKQ